MQLSKGMFTVIAAVADMSVWFTKFFFITTINTWRWSVRLIYPFKFINTIDIWRRPMLIH